MDTVLIFLANALASGTIGHYVGKGLSKIHSDLPKLLDKNSDIQTACELVRNNKLELEILNFYDQIKEQINNSNNENVLNFNGTNNDGIVANIVNINNQKKKVTISPPQGTISSSISHRNYTKYLIDRYHEFKTADVGKGNVNFPIFYASIKREFGAKWDLISIDRFDELCCFIQSRIDKTILGKNRKSKKMRNYSSYEEFITKHHN